MAAHGDLERREADPLALALGVKSHPTPVIVPNKAMNDSNNAKNNALANGTPQAPQATIKVFPGMAGQAASQPQQAGTPMQGAQAAQGLANGPAPQPAAPAVTILPGGQQAVGGTATLGPAPAPANQGNGNAGGVIGTVTITTGVNGGNANAGVGGATNAGNAIPATVTVKPGGQGNQGNGAANQPAAGGVAATVTIKPGAAGATGAAAPQGVAGANACQCMCACPAGAFGGIAGMPGIMGPMNPPPAAAQPTTLATSASVAPGMYSSESQHDQSASY